MPHHPGGLRPHRDLRPERRDEPRRGRGGLNTKELGPIPSISLPAPHHGLVVENHAPIRFREFIVFHGEYVYPEYLLAYRRV